MTVSRMRQDNIHTEGSGIVDTLTPADHDANAVDLEDTLDYYASQFADILGETNWYDAPDKSIATLAAQATLEATLAETEYKSLNAITVPNGQNFKLLTVADLPTFLNKAIATTVEGLVTAQHDGTFGTTHSLAELAGDTAITPRNMLAVVDNATQDVILDSSGRIVWGLLQNESGATDNTDFTDVTPQRAQVSFVVVSSNDLIAAPVAAIEDKVINMAYVRRKALSNRVPQDWMHRSAWVDIPTGSASVTLDNAIDNQSTTPATQATDISIRIDDTKKWAFQDPTGAADILAAKAASGADEVEINADLLDVNVGAAGDIDFDNGIKVDSGGTLMNLGVTAGQIDTGAAAITVKSTGAKATLSGVAVDIAGGSGEIDLTTTGLLDLNGAGVEIDGTDTTHLKMTANDAGAKNLTVEAGNAGAGDADLLLKAKDDINFTTDLETTGIDLDDATAGKISALAGGPHASISAAIAHAMTVGGVDVTFDIFVAGSNYAQGVNIPAATLDLTAYDEDMGTPGTPGTPDLFLFLNGRLVRGASGTGVGDWYAGDTPASGDIKVDFPKGIKAGDVLLTVGLKQ